MSNTDTGNLNTSSIVEEDEFINEITRMARQDMLEMKASAGLINNDIQSRYDEARLDVRTYINKLAEEMYKEISSAGGKGIQ